MEGHRAERLRESCEAPRDIKPGEARKRTGRCPRGGRAPLSPTLLLVRTPQPATHLSLVAFGFLTRRGLSSPSDLTHGCGVQRHPERLTGSFEEVWLEKSEIGFSTGADGESHEGAAFGPEGRDGEKKLLSQPHTSQVL